METLQTVLQIFGASLFAGALLNMGVGLIINLTTKEKQR